VTRRPPWQRGFTLLELLVALVVLAVVGGALLELFNGGLRNVGQSADYTHAALLARSKLAELETLDSFPPAAEGRFDERFYWRLVTADYVDADTTELRKDAIRPVRVALAVAWNDGGQVRSYAVETLFLSRGSVVAQQ
jgi:general secretion pathway protein I